MIADILCPHCRTVNIIDILDWVIKQQDDRIKCSKCRNSYPAHLWELKSVIDAKEKVVFT